MENGLGNGPQSQSVALVLAGSVASFATGRWWPFWVGLTLTCLPVILAILLAEPGHGFQEMD